MHCTPHLLGTVNGKARQVGFTLIEIMVAVVVVAVLAAVAMPSFNQAMRKSRRVDAFATLTAVQQAQERWRSNKGTYATDAQLTLAPPPADPPGLGQAQLSPSGYYRMSVASSDSTGYVIVATAVSSTSQARDAGCQVLAVRVAGGNMTHGSSAADAPNWADPGRCWAR